MASAMAVRMLYMGPGAGTDSEMLKTLPTELRQAWLEGDWFDHDPCTNAQQDPMWYGGDVVAAIRACRVPQEIGSHAFSHLIVGDPDCTAESFDSELRACRRVAEPLGIELKSFVFPRNQMGHFDVLASNGRAHAEMVALLSSASS